LFRLQLHESPSLCGFIVIFLKMEEAGTHSGHQESKVRIVRLPSFPGVWCTATTTTGGAGCAADNWREHLRHEVRHHSFALLSFVDRDHHHEEDHEKEVEDDEQQVERRKSLRQLVADHRERVRPQFFDQPASAKRRLGPDVFAAEATKNKGAAHRSERAKLGGRLGDTGYCLREGIKEQLQVRLGPRMPWPTIDSMMMKEEMETLFEMLDGVGRRCASALVADGASAQLQAMLDPSPEHLRDILRANNSSSKEPSGEKSEDEGYTSSSVMTLTHYFNTDQVRSLFFD
jgi:hypothetical protein